jgi:hypothetical protein
MSHAITIAGDAAKNPNIIQENAADKFLNTTKYNVADMYRNIIAKHAAVIALSTIAFKNAKCAKNGFAIANANMYQNTIGNIVANHNAANQLLLKLMVVHLDAAQSVNQAE